MGQPLNLADSFSRNTTASSLYDPALDNLGVTLHDNGATIRVFSENASSIELVVFDRQDLDWAVAEIPLSQTGQGVWELETDQLYNGARYALKVDGPVGDGNVFNNQQLLIDPYARGIIQSGVDSWRSSIVDERFDWGGVQKPNTPLDKTVIYEAHVKGLTKRHPLIPPALHGSYGGIAHPAMIDHFHKIGVTAVELLPIHAFAIEPRLMQLGLSNFWGYNTLSFFSPHAQYATAANRQEGTSAVLREFKGMVRLLHEAGIEVILDVVYNHTAEEGMGGPRSSFRGIDNKLYYRQQDNGAYIDVTGCGNSIQTGHTVPSRLILDSLRYWANEVQVDGFRFDLAATLGRGADNVYSSEHPLLEAIKEDPALQGAKMIAEPWDVGLGGWQTGNFPLGWSEWNDRYRDRVRNFWLSDIDYARRASSPPVGIGGFATRLAGSSNTYSAERGPLASVNFVTAHDGFTLNDLVSYDVKHNYANGEQNRDGTDTNRSFNHGAEGPSDNEQILKVRRKAMRNLMGTLLLSAGIPMITAGDEFARTQHGNNNAYCQDSPLTWVDWELEPWQKQLQDHVAALTKIRRENPALRPERFATGRNDQLAGASRMDWFDASGNTMSEAAWNDAKNRTLQYLASADPGDGESNQVLLIIHGVETAIEVSLPEIAGQVSFESLWSSESDEPISEELILAPGDKVRMSETSMRLFKVVSNDPKPAGQ